MSDEIPPQDPPVRLVKPRKRHGRGPITRQIYEEMFDFYVKGNRTIQGLMRAVGVVKKTARKAIEHGWPERNWDSLKSRAAFYDKLHDAAASKESPQRAKEARDFLQMRDEYLKITHGVRSAVAQLLGSVIQAVPDATTTATRTSLDEVLDDKGKVLKVVRRTVSTRPSIFDLVAAVNQLAGALDRTGGGELEQIMAKPPTASALGRRKHNLTIAQVQYMAENSGKLPAGVSLADLGDG